MIKYKFSEIFSSGGATLYKNPSDQTVYKSIYQRYQKISKGMKQTMKLAILISIAFVLFYISMGANIKDFDANG